MSKTFNAVLFIIMYTSQFNYKTKYTYFLFSLKMEKNEDKILFSKFENNINRIA